ncbi:hypothetical protein G6L87_03175 [Agrobacterium rhizogenes]|nr:hypothetical protein [Rhizobium rhizogenes]
MSDTDARGSAQGVEIGRSLPGMSMERRKSGAGEGNRTLVFSLGSSIYCCYHNDFVVKQSFFCPEFPNDFNGVVKHPRTTDVSDCAQPQKPLRVLVIALFEIDGPVVVKIEQSSGL